MSSLNDTVLESNKYLKINFDGGDLSSDAGLLLIKEFACKLGFVNILKSKFKTNDTASFRYQKDEDKLKQFYALMRCFRKVVYSVKKSEMILLDLDATLLNTYGHQEGECFNFHYQDHCYHPLVCYDGITGDLQK